MYFFRVEISSFDDAAKTLFIIPEQNADEQGVPFEERFLTMTAEYKAFIKETATSMVDGTYTQFACEERYESISEELFGQLQAEGKLTELDGNSFSISTGFKPKKSGGGKKDINMYLIIGAFALALVVLLIVSAAVGGKSDEDTVTSVETSESVESTENSAPETSEDSTSSDDESSKTSTISTSSDYVDDPPDDTSDTSGGTDENGYTNTGYSPKPTTAASGGNGNVSGAYSISFNTNGGEGSLEGITAEAGQYVVLPSAEDAAESISKKGYKLIGFSDNTEIPYPLYHYKMPYENVTLFAVWEPDTFTRPDDNDMGGRLADCRNRRESSRDR